ncbi:MAG: hypothetical protein Q8M07_18835 [Prosthecobacter sp.]|nr:hypothetical protein [Prosthecobacter sp.]
MTATNKARIARKLMTASRALEDALRIARESGWPDADSILDSDTSSRLVVCEKWDDGNKGEILSCEVEGWSGGML